MILGVDGAGGDWLVAEVESGDYGFALFSSVFDLWEEYGDEADLLLADVPIGLRNDGEPRRCDREARKRVRRGTVFPTPSRPALGESTYEEAKRKNELVTGGKSLSRQTWNILPLIRQVDELLDKHPGACGVVRESHPEVCFWALNGRETVGSNKKTDEGYEERVGVLENHEPSARSLVRAAEEAGVSVKRDDAVDAVALAVTARGEIETIPDDPPTDGRGLPMEMVYSEGV